MRTINNPERGCGNLKEGGTYLRGDMGAGGMLNSWTWALGEHVIGGDNIAITVPARQLQVINLPSTLHQRRISTEVIEGLEAPLDTLPRMALIDHVGSAHYMPMQFATETMLYGPSRRVPKDIARTIAPYTPIPIMFTHSQLLMVDAEYQESLLDWEQGEFQDAAYLKNPWYAPTFTRPDWGVTVGRWRGASHWLLGVQRKLEQDTNHKITTAGLTKVLPPELAENILLVEQVFGISWITSVVYIASEDDDEETLDELVNAGIEPVIAGEEFST